MGRNWQRVHLPFVERAVLLELAERWQVNEEEALRRVLRDAAVRELTILPCEMQPEHSEEVHHIR